MGGKLRAGISHRIKITEFTSSGTYTKPEGLDFAVIEVWGGGGGGEGTSGNGGGGGTSSFAFPFNPFRTTSQGGNGGGSGVPGAGYAPGMIPYGAGTTAPNGYGKGGDGVATKGGGGSGYYTYEVVPASDLNATHTVTIGAAGVFGTGGSFVNAGQKGYIRVTEYYK